ncbi:hypothetical protein ACI3PL_28555, partial [Lacticaseibacillus paracasei]
GKANAKSAKELLEDNESMAKVFDANDKLAAAMAEAKKFREMNRVLEERVRGLQAECSAAKAAAKSWQRRFEQSEKARANAS